MQRALWTKHRDRPHHSAGKGRAEHGRQRQSVCFNCHADIKHYNDSHSRGTKFRPDELRRLRERMFYLVASGKIYLNRGLRESAAVPERAPDVWKKSQASTICSYEFPFFPPTHEGRTDAAVVRQFFERIQQIIALAYRVTAATTPFEDFVYLLSVEEIDLPAHASIVIRTEIHCHLTKFVEVFQVKCEREFRQKVVELPPELESVPDVSVHQPSRLVLIAGPACGKIQGAPLFLSRFSRRSCLCLA